MLDFPSLWVFPAGESHQLVGDSTFGFSRPGILPGVQSVRVVVTPAVDKEEGGPMDTSQRTESRVDQWSPMVIRYNAIRLTSQQLDSAGGCRPREWK